jgi:hypothetical protein
MLIIFIHSKERWQVCIYSISRPAVRWFVHWGRPPCPSP